MSLFMKIYDEIINDSSDEINDNEDDSNDWIVLDKYPRYEISLSIPHVIRDKFTKRIISQSQNDVGYLQISLYGETKLMHRVICEQFKKFDGDTARMDVNHINHKKLDNRIENLEWITHRENLANRRTFSKQINEYIDEINENYVKIESYDNKKLKDRYYYDKENNLIYLETKHGDKYKLVKPSSNGKIKMISLITDKGKIMTRSYNKVLKYLQNRYK